MDVIGDGLRVIILRLADYDPALAAEMEQECTINEIAEAAMLKRHDNECEVEEDD